MPDSLYTYILNIYDLVWLGFMACLEFEFTHYDVAVQPINHYAMGTSPPNLWTVTQL